MKRSVASKFLITFHWGKPYISFAIIAQTTDWLACYKLSIHYGARSTVVEWMRIDNANYFLAATKIAAEVREREREETINMSVGGDLSCVYLSSSLPLSGSRRATEGIINWNRVLCEDSRVKSSRVGLPKRTVAGR